MPPASRSDKGPKNYQEMSKDKKLVKHEHHANAAEEGDTANIKQNTANKGISAAAGSVEWKRGRGASKLRRNKRPAHAWTCLSDLAWESGLVRKTRTSPV